MPPRVVVVDHHDSYTWNLVHLIASVSGEVPEVVQHDEVAATALLEFDRIVLSPGPGDPAVETDFSVGREVLRAATVPVLGVCLGMQGLVVEYGGKVARVAPAHGVLAEVEHDGRALFAGIPQGFAAVRYHSLAAVEVPDCLEVTARDRRSGVVMGVAHRSLPLAGVQFHPESILSEHGADLLRNFLERR